MMNPENIVFAPVVLPLLGAALAICGKAFFKGANTRRIEYTAAFIGLVLPWAALIYTLPLVFSGNPITGVIGNWNEGIGIMYRFDGLAWLVNLLGFAVGGAAWLYASGAGPRGSEFTSIFLIQTAALAATAMTADLFNLFVCLEVMGAASYVLVTYSKKPAAVLAAFSYLMVSAAAMIFFLIGLYGLYRITGVLSYQGLSEALRNLSGSESTTAIVSLSLITAAVAIRVAVMPLYGWLPDAHAMAPHAVSAVLSGVLIKTPLFALSRILVLMPQGAGAGELMGYAGAVTALVAVVIALSQKDAKRLLAYHSISQIGYVVCAWGAAIKIGVSTSLGLGLMTAAFLHALYHALFKGLLFITVGTTIDRTGSRDVYKLRGAISILRREGKEKFPVTFLCFLAGALAISAVPPFNGFASKTAITYALKGTWEYYFLTAAGIGTAASFIKLSRIYWPLKKEEAPQPPGQEAQGVTSFPALWGAELLLGLLCIASGLAAPAIYSLVTTLFAADGGITAGTVPAFYTLDNLIKTLVILVSGVAVFKLVDTGAGGTVLRVIRERPRSFQGLFMSFALGTATLAAWLLFYR